MDNKKLTKKEMEAIYGGVITDLTKINSSVGTDLFGADDVKNINTVKDCRCQYCNLGVTNSNQKAGCACECI